MHVKRLQYNKSSFLVSLPREYIQALRLQKGDHVVVTHPMPDTITIKKLNAQSLQETAANAKKNAQAA